jgi:glycosyltransferase involved in cell wall biosynthesis
MDRILMEISLLNIIHNHDYFLVQLLLDHGLVNQVTLDNVFCKFLLTRNPDQGMINLLIAGYGSQIFEKRCESLSTLPNIKYFGKVSYKDGMNIMYNSDLIYAMYCKTNPNHLYAAPNKYYEALMLGKPILSTIGISIATKILKYDIGYVINETESDLISLIKVLSKEDMYYKGKMAHDLWNLKFKNYTANFLYNEYPKLIG